MLVTKRSGEKEQFDIAKIKQSIAFACEGTAANPVQLESRIDYFMKDGIKTSLIQDNIIQHAIQLASPQEPWWLMVAGHAATMQDWNDFKLRDKSFSEIVKHNIKKGVYTKELLNFYNDSSLEVLGDCIQHKRDLGHSYASVVTGKTKYRSKFELNQHMHMVNAMRFGQVEPEETRIEFVKEVYDVLSKREFSLATPFMSNLRNGGNTASCFIIAVEDDLDSIFANVHRVAKISKNGGGLGIFLGYIRAKGSEVNGAPNAAGSITQWVKIFNSTLVAVNQGGKRVGAGTVALPVWHADIEDFLDMQTEHGDARLKSYDVFPQVTVPDIFMERDAAQEQWCVFCPFEVKNVLGINVRGLYGKAFTDAYLKIEAAMIAGKLKVGKIIPNARDITKIIMRSQFETGLPYITFTDTMNELNPNQQDARDGFSVGMPCFNLCLESSSNILPDDMGHVCNLGSVNLGNIYSDEQLAKVSRLACKILNYGVMMTNHPDEVTLKHNNRYRTIGIGVMGLHDYLAREFSNYSDLKTISRLFETVQYNAILESVELAKVYGSFEVFEKSEWNNGKMFARYKENSVTDLNWDWLEAQVKQFGMYNSQLTSPAPTTSTSIYQDASASVLPVYSAFFAEDNKNGSMKVSSRFLADNPLGYGKTQAKFSATEIIDSIAAMQKFVDTGISMELIFDQNKPGFKAKDLYDAIHHAWKSKLKSIYYIRSIKQKESAGEDCVACAG